MNIAWQPPRVKQKRNLVPGKTKVSKTEKVPGTISRILHDLDSLLTFFSTFLQATVSGPEAGT
jgi:hypothetical protein